MFNVIAQMPPETFWGFAALAALLACILGFVTNLVLRDRGFGVIPNGVLMLVGFLAGAWARYAIFGAL